MYRSNEPQMASQSPHAVLWRNAAQANEGLFQNCSFPNALDAFILVDLGDGRLHFSIYPSVGPWLCVTDGRFSGRSVRPSLVIRRTNDMDIDASVLLKTTDRIDPSRTRIPPVYPPPFAKRA